MVNQIAVDFIKRHEGCRLKAYKDSVGVWTIGYGATGADIKEGLVWTQEQAEERLQSDIAKFKKELDRLVTNLSEKQEAALLSFIFNLGASALASSTLLVKLSQGDKLGAAKEFHRWSHAGGKELKGLLLRRMREAVLFLEGT